MREDIELCTYEKFHKHKILLFLASMRDYSESLQADYQVVYKKIDKSKGKYEDDLVDCIQKNKITHVDFFEIEDKFFEKRILTALNQSDIDYTEHPSPMFLCSRADFKSYLDSSKKPFMKTFYEMMRQKKKILMTSDLKPLKGKYSFDSENRKKLPKDVQIPSIAKIQHTQNTLEVMDIVDEYFPDHPGDTSNFWLATTRNKSLEILDSFISDKLKFYGPYQDAMTAKSDFTFHSLLSPYINLGLITPDEVVRTLLKKITQSQMDNSYSSIEGFIRQIVGWREFIRGIYQNFEDKQSSSNFFNHHRTFKKCWHDGTTGLKPLDDIIKKTVRRGYAHHIERLMVVGNLMVLCEIKPKEGHRWFMEMYVDSSDWVMGPNVYGMALFSDGGIFATKPYVCGSNYIKKMSDYPKGDWHEEINALYWRFIGKNIDYLRKNVRCVMMTKIYDKFDDSKKSGLNELGDRVIERITCSMK